MKPIHDITREKFEKYYHSYVKNVMKENDFIKEFGGSLYEENPKLFHYILRFNYESEE